MKKFCILLVILTISASGLFAQSLQLQTLSGQIILNGATIGLDSTLYDLTVDVYTELNLKNISGSSNDYKVLKLTKKLKAPQEATFCFAGGCFPVDDTLSPTTLTLGPGEIDNEFSAHIYPQATSGSSLVYYKFFNIKNLNDTVSVYVQTEIWQLGINDQAGATAELGVAYPNPANEQLTVGYTMSGAETARLVLQNVLGTAVREESLSGGSGKIRMNVSDLPEGLYFYSLYANGKSVSTRKVVVKH